MSEKIAMSELYFFHPSAAIIILNRLTRHLQIAADQRNSCCKVNGCMLGNFWDDGNIMWARASNTGNIVACEQALVWVLCARCETRVTKPREERRSRESVGRGGSPAPPTSPHALAASPLASRISRIKPKREPARRLETLSIHVSR